MIDRICKLANKLDNIGHTDLSDKLEFVAQIMHRKKKSPIAHQNLVHFYYALHNSLNSQDERVRAYAQDKLNEYEPVFRKYAPELLHEQLEMEF